MKRITYIIIIILILLMTSSRNDVENNMGDYGFTYEKLEESKGITAQISPFYFGEGREGSMRHLLIISLFTFILIIINYKYDNNKLINRIMFFSLLGLSLLVFDETLIRLTGAIIISISVHKFLREKTTG